jgi:hypothetical protein
MANLHQKLTHPEFVEGCFGCKAGTLRLSFDGKVGEIEKQRAWDKELDEYRAAADQGIEPESTKTHDIRAAVRWSEKNGVAYSEEKAYETQATKLLEKVA